MPNSPCRNITESLTRWVSGRMDPSMLRRSLFLWTLEAVQGRKRTEVVQDFCSREKTQGIQGETTMFPWENHHVSMGKSPWFIGKSPCFHGNITICSWETHDFSEEHHHGSWENHHFSWEHHHGSWENDLFRLGHVQQRILRGYHRNISDISPLIGIYEF